MLEGYWLYITRIMDVYERFSGAVWLSIPCSGPPFNGGSEKASCGKAPEIRCRPGGCSYYRASTQETYASVSFRLSRSLDVRTRRFPLHPAGSGCTPGGSRYTRPWFPFHAAPLLVTRGPVSVSRFPLRPGPVPVTPYTPQLP